MIIKITKPFAAAARPTKRLFVYTILNNSFFKCTLSNYPNSSRILLSLDYLQDLLKSFVVCSQYNCVCVTFKDWNILTEALNRDSSHQYLQRMTQKWSQNTNNEDSL